MPGTRDLLVSDRRADPLFFVTAEATEGPLAMLDSTLLPEVRRLVGPRRRVTIAFDREGWSPRRFARWKEEKFVGERELDRLILKSDVPVCWSRSTTASCPTAAASTIGRAGTNRGRTSRRA